MHFSRQKEKFITVICNFSLSINIKISLLIYAYSKRLYFFPNKSIVVSLEVLVTMIEELLAMLEMQEEILQFTHFTNEDAWELGKLIVSEIQRQKLPVAVTIRLNNGYTVFRYAANGTNIQNENWMQRKFNTVRTLETSTLHAAMLLKKSEQTLADWFLDEKEYAAAGGGFPIRIEEVGVIGAVIVSGLPHFADHDLIVKCISRYLHVDEVPRIRGSVNI